MAGRVTANGVFIEERRERRQLMNNDSPLLKLPGELRNRIYDLVLPIDQAIARRTLNVGTISDTNGTCCITMTGEYWSWDCHFTNPLLCLCRAMRTETLGIYYRSNIFMFGTHRATNDKQLDEVKAWMDSRPLAALKTARFSLDRYQIHQLTMFGKLSLLVNLSKGTIEPLITRHPQCDRSKWAETDGCWPCFLTWSNQVDDWNEDQKLIELGAALKSPDSTREDSEAFVSRVMELLAGICGKKVMA
ncbi:hypothetical protein Slin15195_G076140 [Septoria linicola]|uniref:Uncharacterized protein n=1 Tax=Septoria linicola TaxID=215465 RepID=A0A9Q9AXI3_9PEZI|nr:hypothetical protein Slin15195_G076140 [Septoria linicola]